MNGGKSDASTSTDDVKDRPLCLFYFTHPFGVLSPEPPTITAAPPSVTRAFLNMEPISPFYWPDSTAPTNATADESYRSTSPSTLNYDLGDTTVHHNPVSVVSVTRTRRCTVELPRRDSSTLSSSLFASDVWFPSSGSSRVDFPRRAPYTRILPPLQLPSPKDLTDYTSDDIWPRKCLNKFSLPPIELPPGKVTLVRTNRREEPSSVESVGSGKEARCRRKLGVSKARRRRVRGRGRDGDVRRMVGCLMRRTIRGGGTGTGTGSGRSALRERRASPALQHALSTIREAWAEPTSLKDRCRVLSRMFARNSAYEQENTTEADSERESAASAGAGAMLPRAPPPASPPPPRPDASPGLLRRRYSVPETIMRKYRLAQQNSDSEECGAPEGGSPVACGACPSPHLPRDTPRSAGESPRHLRRDRELMRKSALLRRMWARPPGPLARPPASPPACRCESRSLDGSRDELRAELRPERKRQRRAPSITTDALRDRCSSPPRPRTDSTAPASPDTDAPRVRDLSYEDSDALSTSVSTAKETPFSTEIASSIERHFEGRVCGCDPSENEDRVASRSPLAPYEVLEVVVSESASSSPPEGERLPLPPGDAAPRRPPRDMSLDEYVSRVLVESLNSLSDRLEGMTAGVGADRKLSVVEKEIKVRLQNAAVNTIVHLSPTSNNQIIFGNEELCYEENENDLCNAQLCGPPRDECNNPRAPAPREDNNNASPSASPSPTPRTGAFDAVIQQDNVNRAVLHQIQKLFRDEMRHEHRESGARDDIGSVSHIEISSVDAFLSGGAGADTISVTTSDDGSPVAGVRAGNYFRDVELALVPRRCAVPHSASMEVNTSSSEDAEPDALVSDATSLVDSLDDPDSPRSAPLRRRAGPAPPPAARPAPRDRSAAFFVRIRDDAPDAAERARVAECMPERIRQKLLRRHRSRELRNESARRGKLRQLRDQLQRRRAADQLERDAAALADTLLDDIIANVARDECRPARRSAAGAEPERPARRTVRPEPRQRREPVAGGAGRPERRPAARPPRRIYQKSEIREGDKCIEILEILEYSAASRSSPETTPTDDSIERARGRRSRIPVPVPAPAPADHMRLTGGDGRAAPPPELRSRSNSLRFKRVFDMIPEERGALGADSPSPAEEADGSRRASAPNIAPAPVPAPASPPRRAPTRSAGTSPPAEARRRSQSTMTSPSSRSAATSPWRAPPPPPREGSRERCEPERRSMPTRFDRERRETRGDRVAEEQLGAFRRAAASGGRGSGAESGGSSSSERSGGSLLCSLAPRWLAHARARRRPRRAPPAPPAPSSPPADGGWSVTVAGSCRAALPADVEMRLRFPHERRAAPSARHQECACSACAGPPPPAAPALPPARAASRQDRLTLTVKKEAQDSSILATKSMRKSSEQLPDLETYHASRTKVKSSMKTRRGYSLHCWLPDDEPAPIRVNNGLSVLGCAIIPELKPRVPTMSERDLTRVYTPRHYLRS